MRKIGIIADSTCDLSEELLKRYQISIFPLHIHLGEEEYEDGVNITPEQIYEWSDAHKTTPKTSALSPQKATDFLEKQLEEYEQIICFCISEEMSSCANVMRMATDELDAKERVKVIDSRNLSTGIGLQIIEAAKMANEGETVETIVNRILELQPFVRASFVVDTLTYLHRGGRCSGLTALAGSTLRIHPCISVAEGKMQPGKKYRGKMAKIINEYVNDLMPALNNSYSERVFITHSGCEQNIIDSVKKQLEEMNYFDEILITRAGGVVTSHCGPGTLGVLFIERDR